MNSQDFRSLQEAYLEVVEGRKPFPHKKVDRQVYDAMDSGETAGDSGDFTKEKRDYARAEKMRSVAAKHGGKMRAKTQKEQTDIYDIILSHLLDEGYADTQESAEAIMVNMSEEWRESIMIDEGLDMKTFKANRKKAKASAARADAVKRGHVGKEWYNSGRRYSPDEARRGRANMDDEERSTRHRSAVDPEGDDSNYSADKTKNPKKLRKQKAMGEH